jgi:hypothetical protein
MIARPHALALLICACCLLAAGCGDSKDDTPANTTEAVQKCRDEAAKIENAGARKTAEAACDAAKGKGKGKGSGEEVKDAAVKQCLDAAGSIPNESARKSAEAACRRGG